MRRRHYLAATVTALTGCLGGDRRDGGSTATPRPTLPDSVSRTVRVVRADEIPERYETTATVEVVEPRITPDHTARIRVAVRNTGDARREYVFDPNPPMAGARSVSGPGDLLLSLPRFQEGRTARCWKLRAYQHGDGTARVELGPNEAVRNTLEPWDVGEGSGCLPPGDYEFADGYPRFADGDDEAENRWSFTLRLARA